MIFISGDTHGNIDGRKLSMRNFPVQKELTKNDTMIICGDFGFIFDYHGETAEEKYWLNWLESKNFTTIFVLGNHECFPRIYKDYPEVEFKGGRAFQIRPSIFCLKNGEVFEIEGKKIFAMGGASSHDKEYRIENKTWWKEEIPSNEDFENALSNLDKNEWKVDLVVSHCAPDAIQTLLAYWYEHDKITNFLETVRQDLKYNKWFFGHYHVDRVVNATDIAIYDNIYRIDNII